MDNYDGGDEADGGEDYDDADIGSRRRDEMIRSRRVQQQFLLNAQTHLMNAYHYMRFVHKFACYTSPETGYVWMQRIMNSDTDKRCIQAFRMERHVFLTLCSELEDKYGLTSSKNMGVMEKVAVFLHTIALALSNRDVSERFQRSGDTISRVFHQVLDALVSRHTGYNGFARVLLEPRDRTFADVPHKIDSEARYSPFNGAIGCIDGVHMDCVIPEADQLPYFGRKKFTSFNVMAVCDFDMFFTFVLVGWEGSAHDARVFDHAIRTESLNFPHPPEGRYYLCDKGYPDKKGYLVPYSKVNYHRSQFGREAPKNQREGFNRLHSSLRTTIERCFGVLKKRWKVLKSMPFYPVETQVDVIMASFALHNFILAHKIYDTVEDEEDEPKPKTPDVSCYDSRERYNGDTGQGMGGLRDDIARVIWQNRREWLYRNH